MPVQIDAEALVRIRSESGQTQEALAQKAGLSRSGLQALENGRSGGTTLTITALARALEVPVDAISLSIKQAS